MANAGAGADAAARLRGEQNKQVIYKICAPFTDCIREIHNNEVDDKKDLDLVMSIYNLMECLNNYSKTLGRLWKFYKEDQNDKMAESESFNFLKFKSFNSC